MSEWKKVKIGDICKIVKGTTGIASAKPGQYTLLVTAEERKTCSTYQFDCEAVCIPLVSSSGHGKKSLKNVHYQSGKFALGTILCAVIPNNPQELDARYLHKYLQFYKDIILVPLMKGAANVSLSMKDIATVEFPLPPIERQRELSNLFVSLQEKQKELSAEYEKQTEYAKLLHQNILQQAIEGKLTADWRKQNPVQKGNPDYDAEALFEQIQKVEVSPSLQPDKPSSATPSPRGKAPKTPENFRELFEEKLDSERKRTNNARSKTLAPITDEEKPFEIPEGWKWVRLGELCNFGSCQNIEPNYLRSDDWILDLEDIEKDTGRIINFRTFSENNSQSTKHIFHKGYILYSKLRPYLNKVVLAPKDGYCTSEILPLDFGISNNAKYMQMVLMSPYFVDYTTKLSYGMKMPRLGTNDGKNACVPLPPLKEQDEIVNKVETLLAKVTTLENQIQERKTLSEKLAFGIIKEKLEGRI